MKEREREIEKEKRKRERSRKNKMIRKRGGKKREKIYRKKSKIFTRFSLRYQSINQWLKQ